VAVQIKAVRQVVQVQAAQAVAVAVETVQPQALQAQQIAVAGVAVLVTAAVRQVVQVDRVL
jgi:predicted DNA repair protein MutK